MRQHPLVTGEVYHIYNKSIAGFTIFNNNHEFQRILTAVRYYTINKHSSCLARFLELNEEDVGHINALLTDYLSEKPKLVDIAAYCLMPTHIHLILKQLKENGISRFMSNVLNSYTRYFNLKHKRKGPLWEGRFKSKFVETQEQLLHLSRYIHLNPVTAFLIDKPESWQYSSYREYLCFEEVLRICNYNELIDIPPADYKKFAEDGVSYQRELAKIKNLIME
ncbi:MAG: transposase [Candidatus Omnitrophica bacterium]|nr:transposase [Candidatus Omnitrophota bacterium]